MNRPLDSKPPPAQRILVIRLGALGDVVRTRVAFAGLRALYPQAQIHWLVDDQSAAGLVGLAGLDDRIELPRSQLGWGSPFSSARKIVRLVRELRSNDYDLSIDFHGVLKGALLAWAARIPIRLGYDHAVARESSQRFLTQRVELETSHVSRFERNAALVRHLGGEVPLRAPPLALSSESERKLDSLPQRACVIHPGTSPGTPYKRWELERYAEVARHLQKKAGVPSLVSWGPVAGEREAAERVVEWAGGAAQLAPATASLEEFLALLSRARLFIGSDSGPMHLAALSGAALVVLVGPTDPVENAPFPGVPSRVLRHDVGCNPCRKGCPARTCMRRIGVDEVVEAALELVAAAPPVD